VTTRHSLDRSLWPAVALLVASFVLFEFTSIDIWLQDFFYDHSTKKWLVDSKESSQRLFFYTGPKVLVWILAGAAIGLCLAPNKFRSRFHLSRRELLVVIATLATAPALVALSKATTNVFCPYELTRYDGNYAYKKVCETYGPKERPMNRKGKPARGRGFPAGHASGGFALLSLAGLAVTRKGRIIGIMIGLGMGTWMGVYQMLKGAHFLSHTIITAIFCWIVFILWQRVFRSFSNFGR
jgi:membrane-associated PAP2 superfamily phosphatase